MSGLTPEVDASFGDVYIDVAKGPKRWVRVSIKTFENTGQYLFIKLFKADQTKKNFQRSQYITLSLAEWKSMVTQLANVLDEKPENFGTVTPIKAADASETSEVPTKKRKVAKRIIVKPEPADFEQQTADSTQQILAEDSGFWENGQSLFQQLDFNAFDNL